MPKVTLSPVSLNCGAVIPQAKSLDTLMEPIREAIELSAFNAFGLTDDQTVAQVRCVRLVLR